MNKTSTLLITIFLCAFTQLTFAQKMTLTTDLYPNITKNYGRSFVLPYGGLSLNYHYQISNRKLSSGVNFRSVVWGNEISFDQEIELPIYESESISVKNVNSVHFIYPLFYNKQSLGLGLSSRAQISTNRLKRFRFFGGFRLSYNGAYTSLSQNAALLEARIGTSIILKK